MRHSLKVARVLRFDLSSLGEPRRTSQGGMAIPADLTRAGVFSYVTDDGRTIREYRAPDQVFRAETIASLKAAPLALDHPPAQIDPFNFRQFAQGHVGDDVRRDGDKVAATVYAQDQQVLRAIDAGRRELSCGYHCDTDETPGVVPAGEPDAGQPFDRRQTNILYNHVALVDHGRAGSAVRLRLDSAGNQIGSEPVADEPKQKIEIIGGVEHVVGTDAHRDARSRADSATRELNESVQALIAQRAEAIEAAKAQKARADKADKKYTDLVTATKAALSPERMDAAVRARAAIVSKAGAVMGAEWKADGKGNDAIRKEVVAKIHPTIRLDSADAKYVRGLWDGIKVEADPKANERRDSRGAALPALPAHLRAAPPKQGERTDADKGGTVEAIRLDSMIEQGERWQNPPAISKGGRGRITNQSAQTETMK